jgi:hypothetical protein
MAKAGDAMTAAGMAPMATLLTSFTTVWKWKKK